MEIKQANTREKKDCLPFCCTFCLLPSSLFLWFCEWLVPLPFGIWSISCAPRFSVSMCLLRDGRRRWYMKVWWLPLHLCFVRSLPFSLQSPFYDVSVCPPTRCLCVCFLLSLVFFFCFGSCSAFPCFLVFLWVLLQFLLFSVYYCFGFVLCFFSLLCSDFLLWFFVWV